MFSRRRAQPQQYVAGDRRESIEDFMFERRRGCPCVRYDRRRNSPLWRHIPVGREFDDDILIVVIHIRERAGKLELGVDKRGGLARGVELALRPRCWSVLRIATVSWGQCGIEMERAIARDLRLLITSKMGGLMHDRRAGLHVALRRRQ